MKSLRVLLMMILALAASFPAAAQRKPVPVINYENVAVAGPAGKTLSAAEVKQAIQSAAAAKQWDLADQGPGRMLATLHVRGKHTAMTEIRYTPERFSLVYKDSMNLKYVPAPDGTGLIHPFYNRWAEELKEAIRTALAKS